MDHIKNLILNKDLSLYDTKKNLRLCLILITCFSHASLKRVTITVQSGDTFNKILRAHHVNSDSIHSVNQLQAKEVNTLALNDSISLVLDKKSGRLLSCKIQKTKTTIAINRLVKGYHISTQASQPDHYFVSTSTQTNYPIDSKSVQLQRMAQSINPEFEGTIDYLMDADSTIALKFYHTDYVELAFIHQNDTLPAYTTDQKTTPQALLSRTPTNYKRISSHFDLERLHPITNQVRPHLGVDLAGAINTPIWAAADGVVTHKSSDTGYGNMLVISHPFGGQTYYAHMNKFYQNIQVGDTVKAFQTIGYIGSTGKSTGPHLHFELRLDNTAFDPLLVDLPTEHIDNSTNKTFF